MQVRDFRDEIKSAATGTQESVFKQAQEAMQQAETASVTISKLPNLHQVIVINGQNYRVKLVNHSVGEVTLKRVVKNRKLPSYGRIILINGLGYRIKFINHKECEITLKLIGIHEQTENSQEQTENSDVIEPEPSASIQE